MLYVLYCSDQLDGICAAAVVYRALKLKKMSVRFGSSIALETRDQDIKKITEELNSGIFILDFAPEHIPRLDKFLKKLKGRSPIAYWSFTQPQAPETLLLLSQHVKKIDYAEATPGKDFAAQKPTSTELAARRFLPKDPVAEQLMDIARDIKFWLRQDERATKLADLLASGYNRKSLIDTLSRGVIWDDNFEKIRNEYLERKSKAYEELLKKLDIKDYLGARFGFSQAEKVLSTADACQYLLDKHEGIDVAVAVYRNGKIAFRRREGCKLDVGELAKLFGGGGQPYASGAALPEGTAKAPFEAVIHSVDRVLKDHFLS